MLGFCAICERVDVELLATVDRDGCALETVVCCECGLVQHAEIPKADALADFYRSKYRLAYQGRDTPSDRRVYRDWLRGKERFEAISPYVPRGSSVLEIGSGIGCNLKHFQTAGYKTQGIEPGQGFSRYSQSVMGLDVQCALLEDAAIDERHQLVLLVHVLEHLPDPVAALMRIRKFLCRGGMVYVEVPNFSIPHACPSKVFHVGHIFNFTPTTLGNIARKAGYRTRPIKTEKRASTNITVLLTPDDDVQRLPIVNGYQQSISGYYRYSPLTYRLRARKVFDGVHKLRQRTGEMLFAGRTVQKLACAKASACSYGKVNP